MSISVAPVGERGLADSTFARVVSSPCGKPDDGAHRNPFADALAGPGDPPWVHAHGGETEPRGLVADAVDASGRCPGVKQRVVDGRREGLDG